MSRGFTLVEVLVALAVVAVGVGAAVATASRQADTALALQRRSFAHLACQNLVARWRLKGRWPEPGTYSATGTQAGQSWPLAIRVAQTRSPQLRQLRVRARRPGPGTATVTTLTAFLVKPRSPDADAASDPSQP